MIKKPTGGERVRGKYHGMKTLYTGATERPIAETKVMPNAPRHRRTSPKLVVEIDADLLPYFETAEDVNNTLRAAVRAADR